LKFVLEGLGCPLYLGNNGFKPKLCLGIDNIFDTSIKQLPNIFTKRWKPFKVQFHIEWQVVTAFEACIDIRNE
jgi:hypothetical protein